MFRKKYFVIVLSFLMFLFSPLYVKAISVEQINGISNSVYILDNASDNIDCDGSDNSILGNVNNPDSVAWLIDHLFNYIKVLGPLLVIVLSGFDFAGVIIKSDDDAMAKAKKKLIIRLVLAAALFLVPTLISFLLNLFGITSSSVCGIG